MNTNQDHLNPVAGALACLLSLLFISIGWSNYTHYPNPTHCYALGLLGISMAWAMQTAVNEFCQEHLPPLPVLAISYLSLATLVGPNSGILTALGSLVYFITASSRTPGLAWLWPVWSKKMRISPEYQLPAISAWLALTIVLTTLASHHK